MMRNFVDIRYSKTGYVFHSPHGRSCMSIRSQLRVLAGAGRVLLQLEDSRSVSCDRGKHRWILHICRSLCRGVSQILQARDGSQSPGAVVTWLLLLPKLNESQMPNCAGRHMVLHSAHVYKTPWQDRQLICGLYMECKWHSCLLAC